MDVFDDLCRQTKIAISITHSAEQLMKLKIKLETLTQDVSMRIDELKTRKKLSPLSSPPISLSYSADSTFQTSPKKIVTSPILHQGGKRSISAVSLRSGLSHNEDGAPRRRSMSEIESAIMQPDPNFKAAFLSSYSSNSLLKSPTIGSLSSILEESPPTVFKIAVLGDQQSGKTSLINFFSTKTIYQREDLPPIDFFMRSQVEIDNMGESINFELLEFCGKDTKQLLSTFLDADLLILCIDMSDHRGFQKIKSMWEDYLRMRKTDCNFILCGMKKDVKDSRATQEGLNLAFDLNSDKFFEVSLNTKDGTEEVFSYCLYLAERITKKKQDTINEEISTFSYNPFAVQKSRSHHDRSERRMAIVS